MSRDVKVVILHNGGVASATLVAIATRMYSPEKIALVTYRGLTDKRLEASVSLAQHFGIPHVLQRTPKEMQGPSDVLNMILGTAQSMPEQFPEASSLIVGMHIKTESKPNYQRAELWKNLLLDLHGGKIFLQTPQLELTESDIVKQAVDYEVPLELTRDCVSNGEKFCGHCYPCRVRIQAFKEAHLMDYDYEGEVDFGLSPEEQREFEHWREDSDG